MKKRFIGLYLLCCALPVGCAAAPQTENPTEDFSVPQAAVSESIPESVPEKTPEAVAQEERPLTEEEKKLYRNRH